MWSGSAGTPCNCIMHHASLCRLCRCGPVPASCTSQGMSMDSPPSTDFAADFACSHTLQTVKSTFLYVLEARSAMHVMQLVKQSGSTSTALSPQWHLVSTGTPATTLMACSTTTKMPTGNELSIGVTRQAARLQPLTLPLKVNICLCRFLLAGTCVEALALYHLLCDSAIFLSVSCSSKPISDVLCLLFSLVCATYLSGTH